MSSLPLALLVVVFVGCAAVIWIAGIRLSDTTDVLDDRLHLGSALGGVVLLAIATNLPEIIITVAAAASGLAGPIRLTAPLTFGTAHLGPALADFAGEHPGIELDILLEDSNVDLVGGGFDLALRIAALADSSLKARRLCRVRRLLVGAPAYFARHGRPGHPRELAGHACLGYAYLPDRDRWRFVNAAGEEAVAAPASRLRANNADALGPALLAGLGVAVQPEFAVWEDMAAGRLEAVMPDWSLPPIALHVVTPPGGPRPARVAATVGFLVDRLGAAPWATAAGEDDSGGLGVPVHVGHGRG